MDFYLPDRNLVIEADGDYWHSLEKNKKNDLKKDQYMEEKQINLARLKEADIRLSCKALVRSTLAQFPILGGGHDIPAKDYEVIQRRFEW